MTLILDNEALTRDGFLGGQVQCWQPKDGFRAGVDSVMLAAAVEAKAGQSVLELGCGPGVVLSCLGTRVAGLEMVGLELQSDYAELARRNGVEAGLMLEVFEGDVANIPGPLRGRSFDHVVMNPPYFAAGAGTGAAEPDREAALRGGRAVDWVSAAARRLKPKGTLTLIQHIDRLPETLAATEGRLGSVDVLPLCGRAGRPAGRFLMRARKEGRRPFQLLAPLALHSGDRHKNDRPDYDPQIADILAKGASLAW